MRRDFQRFADLIETGRLDTAAMAPIARCGYADYAVVDKVFSIRRPEAGIQGSGVSA